MDENQLPRTLTDEEMQEEKQPQGQPEGDESTGKSSKPENQPNPDEEEQEQKEEEISNDPVNPEEREEEQEPPVSRRESKRIQQLLDKMSQGDQDRLQPRRGQPEPRSRQQIIPEGEYDTDQVNQMAQEYGQQLFKLGLSQAQALNIANTFATRLEIDSPKVAEKYRFLDKSDENQEFNPGAAGFINRMYLSAVGYDPTTGVVENPDLRYSEFVEGFMEVVGLVAAGKTAETTRNVQRRAAQTGVRPGGVSKSSYQGDDPRRMSDEQLDAMIKEGLGI